MLRTRRLPRAEWDRLAGTECAALAAAAPGLDATVLVVEDARGGLVGTWALVRLPHLEGAWVHPAHRGHGAVARHLVKGMRAILRADGRPTAWTAAASPVAVCLAEHLGGQELPATLRHFVVPTDGTVPIEGRASCR